MSPIEGMHHGHTQSIGKYLHSMAWIGVGSLLVGSTLIIVSLLRWITAPVGLPAGMMVLIGFVLMIPIVLSPLAPWRPGRSSSSRRSSHLARGQPVRQPPHHAHQRRAVHRHSRVCLLGGRDPGQYSGCPWLGDWTPSPISMSAALPNDEQRRGG